MADDKDKVITDYEKGLLSKEYALLLENEYIHLNNTLEKNIHWYDNELNSKNKQINDLNSKITILKRELGKYKNAPNNGEIKKLSSQLVVYETLIKHKDSKINDLKFKLEFSTFQYDKLISKFKNKQKELYVLNHDANFYKNECLNALNKIDSLERVNKDIKKDLKSLKDENIKLTQELNESKIKNKKLF